MDVICVCPQDRGQRGHRAQQDERGAARPAVLPEGHAARRAAAARGQEEPFLGVVGAGIGTENTDRTYATLWILFIPAAWHNIMQ